MSVSLLLVDDEAVDLEWMRRRVLNSGLDIEVAGAANNGFNALKVMESERIDLILSDIRMPIMSGTDFARKAKAINPEVKIVFISGHEDFHYAKQAIELNASAYLLKPVEDAELYETLADLCKKVEKEREEDRTFSEALSLVNEELLLRWLNGDSAHREVERVRRLLTPILEGGTAAALIEIDDVEWKTRDSSERARRAQTGEVISCIRSFAAEHQLGTCIAIPHERCLLLASVQEDDFLAGLQELVVHVQRKTSFTVTASVGPFADDEAGLWDSYQKAQAALSAKWLLGKNRLLREAAPAAPAGETSDRFDERLDEMIVAIKEYDLVAIDDCLLRLFGGDAPLSSRNEAYELIIRITSRLHAELLTMNENLYELLKWDTHQPDLLFQFETVHDILSWLRRRFFELSELLYVKRQRQKRKLIDSIISYVEENLEQKLTLKEVAAHFDFTPNYLGYLFKEETGTHFSDFLNERRLARVCQLLADPGLKIYEVAERMGYKNIIYFNRQFKQAMNMTPGEYRKKHKI
ncbi:AraC family transcriptional regulator [Paenibacillus stellifer]|uniref:AraC family transcriptional regulator n=1 Tax=Paenibacillus stellifer TaxID=169760 RepID=A0A089N0S8_9BACL|nr:response regulator [Paenibacillus stellifer]AIQ62269.1 AraC family transcriptional regulator [Paenibacillus stellifer]